MAKAPYTPCKLYVDGADGIAVGDYITTAAGSAYLVQTLRVSRTRSVAPGQSASTWTACAGPLPRCRLMPGATN